MDQILYIFGFGIKSQRNKDKYCIFIYVKNKMTKTAVKMCFFSVLIIFVFHTTKPAMSLTNTKG